MPDRVAAAALGLALFVPAGLAAQERAPAAPVFQSDVSLVLLPVFVIDSDGKASRGLQPADFEVKEDGRKARIVSFRYVDTTDSEQADEIPLASAARRRFLLLFDKSFTDPAGLNRAQRAAADFVRRRLVPSDLAAVATFDIRRGMRLVANFTEDRALLGHAIRTLGVPTLSRISDPLALAADLGIADLALPADSDQSIPQALLDNVLGVLVHQIRSAEERDYRNQIATLIEGLRDLAVGLRRVEGRKQVVFLSAGFDARLLVGQWGEEQKAASESISQGRLWEVDGMTRYGDSRLREALAEATRDLARADAVVHAVDVTGLGSDRSLERTSPNVDLVRDTTHRESLNFLSAETGGRFFKDANDLEPALAEMLEMTSRYYVLGVQPERERGPGTFHKIGVKVARKGVKLSHRPGYFERGTVSGQTLLQRQFDAAQLVVTGEGLSDLDFTALCLPFPREGERQTLGLVMQVPRESLTWKAGTAVEVYGYAVADDGTVRDHLAQLARVDPAKADPQGGVRGLSFFGTLNVPPGRYSVRLLVREGESSGVQVLDVTVPPHDPDVAFLLPPIVVDEPERWLRVGMGAAQEDDDRRPFPFQMEGKPFLPRASSEVRPGATERLVLMAYEPALFDDPAQDLEIRSSLTARDGRLVPPGRLKIDRVLREANGRRTYVLRYTVDPIETGDYTLRIGIGEGGSLVESYTLLRVRAGS